MLISLFSLINRIISERMDGEMYQLGSYIFPPPLQLGMAYPYAEVVVNETQQNGFGGYLEKFS